VVNPKLWSRPQANASGAADERQLALDFATSRLAR
jgi:hypothetical protein